MQILSITSARISRDLGFYGFFDFKPNLTPYVFSDLTGNLFTTIDVAAYGQLERLVLDLNKNIEAQLGLSLPKSLREL